MTETPGNKVLLKKMHPFQHEGTEWQLVHRHADPLVHAISMEHMAVLARGDS